jgi:sigma-E factor negative regulatory protein RseA
MTVDISSLMDGEIEADEASALVVRVAGNPDLERTWEHYHLIGDCLRGEGGLSADFGAKLKHRLHEEPTVLAPPRKRQVAFDHPVVTFSAAASVAIITFVGWAAYQSAALDRSPAMASAPSAGVQPVSLALRAPVGNFNPYLVAHQEVSPSMGMEGVTPYIRTVASSK